MMTYYSHLNIHSTYIGYCQVKFATQKDNDKNKREKKNAVHSLEKDTFEYLHVKHTIKIYYSYLSHENIVDKLS